MTVGVTTFRGERLREARLARGMFKKTLADLSGVSGTAITRYEDGEDKPQHERLKLLAANLGFPVDFFLRPGWMEPLEPVFWRSRASESKSAREMTEQRMKWVCEIFAFLDSELNFSEVNVPSLSLPDDFRLITGDLVEDAAEKVRVAWHLHSRPIKDVMLALENAGIPVASLEIASDKQDGFCFRSASLGRPFVGINTYNVSACRARHDAAHEFGHLVLHGKVTPQQERDPAQRKIIEQQAHRFAGAFLFPKDAFRDEVGYPSLDYFCDLKKKWGISIAAMVFRSHDLGLIDELEKSSLYENMGRRRWRGPLREPFDSPTDMPLERPRMLKRGVETLLLENIFGRSDLLSVLSLPTREIEQITGVERGFLDSAEVIELAVSVRSKVKAVDLESGNILEFPGRHK